MTTYVKKYDNEIKWMYFLYKSYILSIETLFTVP